MANNTAIKVRQPSPILNQCLFFGLLGLVIWLPIPFGSHRAWAWAIMEVLSFSMLSIWLIEQSRIGAPLPVVLGKLKVPLIFLALWLIFQLFQSFPLPVMLVKLLNPAAYEVYAYVYLDQEFSSIPLSIDSGATLGSFLKNSAYCAIFFLTLVLVDRYQRMLLLTTVLVYVGVAEVFYAFWHLCRGTTSGTYINGNHFAGFLEIVISVTVGRFLASRRRNRKRFPSWKIRVVAMLDFVMSKRSLFLCYIIGMLAALFFTGSRGGIAGLFIGISLALVLARIHGGKGVRETRLFPLVIVLLIATTITLTGTGSLGNKLESAGLKSDRSIVNQSTLEIISDYPVFGTGAGTWRWAYPRYKDPRLARQKTRRYAHNDHLELLSEQGIIGTLLLGSAISLILLKIIKAFKLRGDPLTGGVLVAAVSGSSALLVHGLVDFNFRIPANAAYFMVLLAMGSIAACWRNQGLALRQSR